MSHLSHRTSHKAQTDYKPHDVIIDLAEKRIQFHYNDWPEDDWFSLSLTAELNLYLSDTKRGPVRRAAIYPVIEGRICTRVWYRLFIQQAIGEYPP